MALNYQIANFKAGMLTEPAEVEAGIFYTRDMKNLRASKNGNLELRYVLSPLKDPSGTLTGLAAIQRGDDVVVFYQKDGVLGVLLGASLAPATIYSDASVTGRISVALIDENRAVVFTEGSDQGVWVDLSGFPASAPAYPLGLAKLTVAQNAGADIGATGALDQNQRYYYLISAYRKASPFEGTESVLSNIIRVVTAASGADNRTVQLTGLPAVAASTGADSKRVYRTEGRGIPSPIGTATGGDNTRLEDTTKNFDNIFVKGTSEDRIILNVTDGSMAFISDWAGTDLICEDGLSGGADNLFQAGDAYEVLPTFENLQFRHLTTLGASATSHVDQTGDSVLLVTDPINTGNKNAAIQAPDANVVTKYRDRLWVAGYGEPSIRSSEIQGTELLWYAFKATNQINVDTEVVFCTEYRDVLLFGGPNGVWRLTGSSPYDYDVEQISDVGPLDGYAWKKGLSLLYFVGINGLYATDGVSVHALHEPIREFFKDIQIKKASVLFFPSEEVLFNCYVDLAAGGTASYQFLYRGGLWEKWEDVNVLQGDWVVTTSAVDGEKTLDIYIAEQGGDEIREILWDRTGFIQDTTLEGTTDIDWLWESQDINFLAEGAAGRNKLFRRVEIGVGVAMSITVKVYVDDTEVVNTTLAAIVNKTSKVRIGAHGEKARVQLSGTGHADIRLVRIVAVI